MLTRIDITLDNLGNAAFGETEAEQREEIARILGGYINALRGDGELNCVLRDRNGNRVGIVSVWED